jgi:hypothetical protein
VRRRKLLCAGPTRQGTRGQAIVEYVLMLAFIIAIVTTIAIGFRSSIFQLWRGMTKEIAAPCPGCTYKPKF